MSKRKFAKTHLATSLSLILGVSISTPIFAQEQDEQETEIIEVTGIRGSLQEAASIKRYSAGIVDAISAEDIGKFPDTNLAESLQRITGVSISRTNGEGSEVTVRGFAGGNNMITLNGRTMPAAITYGAGSGADGTTRGGTPVLLIFKT
ncbi:TonB-dependent receptor plug domain-containing protein [Alteromonas mediterranea]|uniref:TonB-dependent receptor plug domain-containing protein n=1 Tax=Alteromonas mediterranea TaxID=314275 RepID=UPI00031C527C|nr:TonB-dependent receptor plug domain-containing protein [Alteromonas mediterranea]